MAEGAGRGRTFTEAQVNAILARAVERQHAKGGELSYEELLDVARQAGISVEAVEAAVRDVEAAPPAQVTAAAPAPPEPEIDEVRAELAARTWSERRRFVTHFTVYAMVMTLLAVINWQTWDDSEHRLWFLYPALGWGVALSAHFMRLAYGHVFPDPRAEERVRRELRKRSAKRQVRVAPSVRVGEAEGEELEAPEARRAARRS